MTSDRWAGVLRERGNSGMQDGLVAIVMAAGKGTRMKSSRPKVLHEIAGVSLLGHVLRGLAALDVADVFVIVGHGADQVRADLPQGVRTVLQREQLGTGHAVGQVIPHLQGFTGQVLILSGDVPLLRPESLKALEDCKRSHGAALSLLTTLLGDPTGYGRVLRDAAGLVAGIVEHKDASEAQRRVQEVNLGTYLCDWPLLQAALEGLKADNAQSEYYLTDAIAALVAAGHGVVAHCLSDATEGMGVNTRVELARLASAYQRRTNEAWMLAGVTIVSPEQCWIGPDVQIGVDTVLEPGTCLSGHTRVGEGCRIGAYSHLHNVVLGRGVTVLQSHLVDAEVGDRTQIGPYAHLRGHARIGADVRLGNFVEVKNSELGQGTKAAHLAYLGDATLGERVNVGCGVITVNYDGERKHRTVIADGAFVGSNSNLVAPLTIGSEAYVAAGSTITEDVPAEALAIGRGRQVNKPAWVSARKLVVQTREDR
jgi:bifunctional UDP-N-acetylglucosamine pyrophosphorylase/glucosamine-1-phosphate N-acetyltransferase